MVLPCWNRVSRYFEGGCHRIFIEPRGGEARRKLQCTGSDPGQPGIVLPSIDTVTVHRIFGTRALVALVSGDVDNSTAPRMVGDAEGVAVVNRR